MAYPTKRTKAVVAEILDRLRRGEPLAAICRESEAFPSVYAFLDWVRADDALSVAYARAREDGEMAIELQALEILDEPTERFATEHGFRRDPAHVQDKRQRFEGRLKLLKVWNPKRYAEKVDVEHGGNLSVTIGADIAKIL